MRNDRVLGICFIVIGALFAADGFWSAPVRWLRVAMGVAFAVVGVLRLLRAWGPRDTTA